MAEVEMGRLLTDEVHIIQAKHMLVETTPLTFYSVGGARTLPLYCIVSFPAHRFRFQHGRGKGGLVNIVKVLGLPEQIWIANQIAG